MNIGDFVRVRDGGKHRTIFQVLGVDNDRYYAFAPGYGLAAHSLHEWEVCDGPASLGPGAVHDALIQLKNTEAFSRDKLRVFLETIRDRVGYAVGGYTIIKSQDAYGGNAWRAFCESMRGRQYGEDETRDAWEWFLAGYAERK